MDELFRFRVVRSAQSVDPGVGISLATTSEFQTTLAAEAKRVTAKPIVGVTSTPAFVQTATAYLGSELFPKEAKIFKFGEAWKALATAVSAKPPNNLSELDTLISSTLGANSAAVVADPGYAKDVTLAKDALTAAYISPAGHLLDMSSTVSALKAMNLVSRSAAKDAALASAADIVAAMTPPLTISAAVLPQSGTTIRPTGMTDLLVVRQQLTRYEKGEIQAIENIVQGESRSKSLRDQITSQTTDTSETDTTTQVTKESDQTEQFSLQNEVDKTLQEQLAVKAGASVSYHGPSVDASVNASVDYSQAKSDSEKVASNYAREVVSKAATQVTTEVKQQVIQQFTEVTETLEDHTFDNSKGAGNISAVYQWLNKIYTAQIFNYGVRQIYDVIVPEPSLQWIAAFANLPNPTGLTPEPPPAFNINPSAITVATYQNLALTYRASSVPEPPEENQIAAATAIATKDQMATDAQVSVKIPEGYVARKAMISVEYDWGGQPNGLEVLLGEQNVGFVQNENPKEVDLSLDGAGDIPCAIHAYNLTNYSVSIRVECDVTAESKLNWQQQVFDKLLAGYSSWKSDYADSVSKTQQALAAQGDPKLGGNEDENRAIERTELKRTTLQLLLGNFNLAGVDLTTVPHPKLPDAITQGEYVRFFEQAFEWEQMSYVLYPYFWGDQSRWISKLQLATDDSLFEAFLRAGSARVVISVRPGFGCALDYFFSTGQLWFGKGPPPVSSPLYVPISEELKEQSGAPGDETPYGDPWEVNIPTTLIRLRTDNKLPTWVQANPTKWVWSDGPAAD